eukprot:7154132-Pyramimonas_sp.AAC.1
MLWMIRAVWIRAGRPAEEQRALRARPFETSACQQGGSLTAVLACDGSSSAEQRNILGNNELRAEQSLLYLSNLFISLTAPCRCNAGRRGRWARTPGSVRLLIGHSAPPAHI